MSQRNSVKLDSVEIKNFRSLEDVSIKCHPNCRILVGINESGKSNILRALSMLDKNLSCSDLDVREPLRKELPITAATIEFIFELNENELTEVYNDCMKQVLFKEPNAGIIRDSKVTRSFRDICLSHLGGLIEVDVLGNTRNTKYYAMPSTYTVMDNLKKPSSDCPPTFEVKTGNGKRVLLDSCKLINYDDFPDIPGGYLKAAELEDVESLVGVTITNTMDLKIPEVIFWKYDESLLLPPFVILDEFAANPETCIPLKNMFILAGYTEIQKALEKAKTSSSPNALSNLLSRVANATTEHFRKVWREYKSIEFELRENGPKIDASVKEVNNWAVMQRSDGFKRFVAFLLTVSTKVKSKAIENALLLIDEPDVGLHPSGAKFLRDEILRISRTNNVFYATHSPFMIDRDYIGRHLIVTKDSEKSSVSIANESNISDEEVIYNALGYSMFEALSSVNLVFEGWRDKRLFQVALGRGPSQLKALKDTLKKFGLCHARGVSQIRTVSALLELANRKCWIISDCDRAAKSAQKEYLKAKGYGHWLRYDQIYPGLEVVTGEDFLTESAVRSALKKTRLNFEELTGDPNIEDSGGRVCAIRNWLKLAGRSPETVKEFVDRFKTELFVNLKSAQVSDCYYEFLNKLTEKLDNDIVTD